MLAILVEAAPSAGVSNCSVCSTFVFFILESATVLGGVSRHDPKRYFERCVDGLAAPDYPLVATCFRVVRIGNLDGKKKSRPEHPGVYIQCTIINLRACFVAIRWRRQTALLAMKNRLTEDSWTSSRHFAAVLESH